MRYPVNPADLGEPYEDRVYGWCVDEESHPECRGYVVHKFLTEAEAKQFLSDNAAAYNAQKLPEVSGMGVAVGGEKSDTKAALEALNALGDSSTLPDEQRNELEMAIRAALTAKPYIVNISEEEATALLQDSTPGEISYVSNAALTAQDVNAELLEALKEVKYKSESHLNNGLGDFAGYISDIRMIVTEAIASAEQNGGV